ncbi:Gldg family protein [Pedobacter africanus]|uniref:ABC-2 type transport system permease protein n=1 Tax=Pedobacter africanus TaxID=151894 RepID=A0A1W2DV92_9SPHI|nr:Gldg family protein [Pedobacter africanus]SMD01445.1 ABC-2 type transport system permease protein [Pedobacter africanus]
MRTIFKIARFELSTLFYSPVAWLVLMIFPIQAGLDITKFIQMIGRASRMGQEFTEITDKIFGGNYGFFAGVKNTLYLYIPLLTMGLISRETHSGSIKLLLSSPVKVRDIVLGKYLAMMAYGLILIFIVVLFGVAGGLSIKNMDYGQVFAGTFGLYLLICAYAAIGLFMSSLTSYQVVAAISTLGILGVLNFIGSLLQGVDLIRHVTYFLSISGRTEQAISGLISTEDVAYFLIVIFFFLMLTGIKLQAGREAKPLRVKLLRYMALIFVCFVAGYISSRPSLTAYLDLTAVKTRTLNASSVALIKTMDKPLRVTTYVNILDENYYMAKPEVKSADEKTLMQYRRFMPDLKMDYVYYYDVSKNANLYKSHPGMDEKALAKSVADVYGLNFESVLTPAQIRKIVNLSGEENRVVRQLSYGDQKTFLRYFNDMMMYASEQEITAAIKRIVMPSKIPVVIFLTGHDERSTYKTGDKEYRVATTELTFRYALINQGFDVDTVSLQTRDIPAKTSVLVIADPGLSFSASDLDKIKRYIDRGGNLLITTEPGRQTVLSPLLAHLGIGTNKESVIEKSRDFAPDFILAKFSEQAGPYFKKYNSAWQAEGVVAMPGAVSLNAISASAFNITPILTDQQKHPLVLALTRRIADKEQRIMIAGDADFMSSVEIARGRPVTRNFDLITETFRWFTGGEFPVNTYRPKSQDVISSDDNGVLAIRIFFFGILPFSLLITATLLLIYRKRR